MLSNRGALFPLRTSTEFSIAVYTSGLFGLKVEINGKTSSVCFYFGFSFEATERCSKLLEAVLVAQAVTEGIKSIEKLNVTSNRLL